MPARVGELDTRVAIQRPVETANEVGDVVESWITTGHAWAKVDPLTSREFLSGGGLQANVTHEVWLRFNSDVDHKTRLTCGDRVFHVAQIFNEGERKRWTRLLCREEVS